MTGRRARVLACAALLALACGNPEPPPEAPPPAHARAALLLEPPVVRVGDVADLVLAVVTPPGVGVRPVVLPERVPGFAIVERERQEITREPSRWVHRTRLRLRALEVGRFEFPGGSVELEDAEGGVEALAWTPLPLEVVSTVPDHAGRTVPYGIRTLPGASGGPGTAVAFVAGVALALGAVALLVLARRRLAVRAPEPRDPAPPPWETARESLQAARERLETDPRRALDCTARVLRRYAVQRFGGDADVRTTPELEQLPPPFTMTTRWRAFLDLLAALDAARLPPRSEEGLATTPQSRVLVDEALAFVEATTPPEVRG